MKRTHADAAQDGGVSDDSEADASDDSNEGEDENVAPYNAVQQERLPESPVYTEEFAQLRQALSEFVALLKGPFKETEYRNGVIDGLMNEVDKRTKGGFPENICIALIGEMGAGKSSLINSILSTGMIARQGDGGNSCTWVTQEFCYCFPKQTMSLAAEIHFFDQQERRFILRSLFAAYYHASPMDEDSKAEARDGDQKAADFAVMKTTVDAFRGLFGNRKEFETPDDARKYLNRANAADDKGMLNQLYMWADELMAKELKGRDSIFEQDSTPQTLLFKIGKYCFTVAKSNGMQPACLWPFVSYIKFGLDNQLLRHGISILDIPGLSDTNSVRVNNALRHLERCTHGAVVVEVARAGDEAFMRSHLAKGFMERGSGRTMVLLTYADEIDDNTVVEMTTKEQDQIDELFDRMLQIDDEKQAIIKKIRSSKRAKRYKYMAQRDELEVVYRKAEAQQAEIRSIARSRNVIEELQGFYAQLTPDPLTLPAWCVGNKAYKQHQAGYKRTHPPTLSVEGTSIPIVRQHMYLIPAEGVINETRHLVTTQIPTLLSCVGLYVNKTHMARKGEIEAIVLKPQTVLPDLLQDLFKEMWGDIRKHILDPYLSEEYNWTRDAKELCDNWAFAFTTSVHLTMLKNKGRRKGKGKNAVGISWNWDLLQINHAEVELFFRNFAVALLQYPKEIIRRLEALISGMANEIQMDEHVSLMALQPFLDYLYLEKGNIETMVNEAFRSLRCDFSRCSRDTINDIPECHLAKAMERVYNKCALIKGKAGTPKDRLEMFEDEVTKLSGVWAKAHDSLRDQFRTVLKTHREALKTAMMEFFVEIGRKFNMMCSSGEGDEEAEGELRKKLQKNLVLAREKLEKEIRPGLAACLGTAKEREREQSAALFVS